MWTGLSHLWGILYVQEDSIEILVYGQLWYSVIKIKKGWQGFFFVCFFEWGFCTAFAKSQCTMLVISAPLLTKQLENHSSQRVIKCCREVSPWPDSSSAIRHGSISKTFLLMHFSPVGEQFEQFVEKVVASGVHLGIANPHGTVVENTKTKVPSWEAKHVLQCSHGSHNACLSVLFEAWTHAEVPSWKPQHTGHPGEL